MSYFVYTVTNLTNNKIYVGKTNNPRQRWNKHLWLASIKNHKDFSVIHAALAKYGTNNFSFEIKSIHETEPEALATEMNMIAKLKLKGFVLYNCTNGGEGISGYKHSLEMRKHFSLTRKGKKLTEKTKQKISNALTGRERSAKHCEAIRAHRTGTICPQITRTKNSIRFKGEKSNTAKLTEKDVIQIKTLLANKTITRKQIAIMFNISYHAITDISLGRSWSYIVLT